MKGMSRILIGAMVGMLLWGGATPAKSESTGFEVMLFLTQQDKTMDWWNAVPDRFYPQLTAASQVTRNEYFKILPFFNNYALTPDGEVNITYDIEILKPDGTVLKTMSRQEGYRGPVQGVYVLPASPVVYTTFDDDFPYGAYTLRVTAVDHVKNQTASDSKVITLKEFELKKFEGNWEAWCLAYPTAPQPAEALSVFLSASEPYLIGRTLPVWSSIWFYKCVFEENGFLLPQAAAFYASGATVQQKKNLILLFYLLDRLAMLPVEEDLAPYTAHLKGIRVPDPYRAISSGDQLDMLWAEFFATARLRPVRQIITGLNLYIHAGVLDKVKTGELPRTEAVIRQAELDAVFRSTLWSLRSNCEQSTLFYQFCVGLYESGRLNEKEKGYLGAILHDVPPKDPNAMPEGERAF